MTCTTPLVAFWLGMATLAWLMNTLPPCSETRSSLPSTVLIISPSFRSLVKTRGPATTWYARMSSSCALFSGLRSLVSSPAGSALNASSVGAKTVNGPWPSRVLTSAPALRAATSKVRSLLLEASWTMFAMPGPGPGGPPLGQNWSQPGAEVQLL